MRRGGRRPRETGRSRAANGAPIGRRRHLAWSEEVGLRPPIDRRPSRAIWIDEASLPARGADGDHGGDRCGLHDASASDRTVESGARDKQVDSRRCCPASPPDAEPECRGRGIEIWIAKALSWRRANARPIGAADGIRWIVPKKENVVVAGRKWPLVPLEIRTDLGAVRH